MMDPDAPITPGPWEWDSDDLHTVDYLQRRAEFEARPDPKDWSYVPYEEPIVQTDSGVYGPNGGDRRLIAAAPDLLAACEMALPLMEEWLQGAEEAHEQLRGAIKKARGE